MKSIFENWRKYATLNELQAQELPAEQMQAQSIYDPVQGGFIVSKNQIKDINKSIERIYSLPEEIFGIPREAPKLNLKKLTRLTESKNDEKTPIENAEGWFEDLEEKMQEEVMNNIRWHKSRSPEMDTQNLKDLKWEDIPDEEKIAWHERSELYDIEEDKFEMPFHKLLSPPEGSEGELFKFSDLSREDFEEKKLVIPISEESLTAIRKLYKDYEREKPEKFRSAQKWYKQLNEKIKEITDNDVGKQIFLSMLIAALSPRAAISRNILEAYMLYRAVIKDIETTKFVESGNGHEEKTGKQLLFEYIMTGILEDKKSPSEIPERPPSSTGAFIKKSFQAYKTPNFFVNIIWPEGEWDWNTTVDTWIIELLYPDIRRLSSTAEWAGNKKYLRHTGIKGEFQKDKSIYRYMSLVLKEEADTLGIPPLEFQAIIWCAARDKASKRGTKDYETTLLDALQNLQDVKVVIDEEKENNKGTIENISDIKSWHGIIDTLLEPRLEDETDREKFEEAGKELKEKLNLKGVSTSGPKNKIFNNLLKKGTSVAIIQKKIQELRDALDIQDLKNLKEKRSEIINKYLEKAAKVDEEYGGLIEDYINKQLEWRVALDRKNTEDTPGKKTESFRTAKNKWEKALRAKILARDKLVKKEGEMEEVGEHAFQNLNSRTYRMDKRKDLPKGKRSEINSQLAFLEKHLRLLDQGAITENKNNGSFHAHSDLCTWYVITEFIVWPHPKISMIRDSILYYMATENEDKAEEEAIETAYRWMFAQHEFDKEYTTIKRKIKEHKNNFKLKLKLLKS